MRRPEETIELHLRAAAKKRGWLRFVRHASVIGGLSALLALALGLCALHDWPLSRSTTALWLIRLFLATGVALLVAGMSIMVSIRRRGPLVKALEKANPRLQDRMNTLWSMHRGEIQVTHRSFVPRIAEQICNLCEEQPLAPRSSTVLTWLQFILFALVATVALWFFITRAPLAGVAEDGSAASEDFGPLVIPEDAPVPPRSMVPWREVRVVRPGRNLTAVGDERIDLQIEASANEPIARVAWHTAINGGADHAHRLPAPPEPQFASYSPVLDLDDFALEVWDVLSYFADAALEKGDEFSSDVYFIEVRPPPDHSQDPSQEQDAPPVSPFDQLAGLIGCQQEVVRAAHHLSYAPLFEDEAQHRETEWLAKVERELASASDHLAAGLRAILGPLPPATCVDHLHAAGDALAEASEAFARTNMPEGHRQAQGALRGLLSARKDLHRAMTGAGTSADPASEPSNATPGDVDRVAADLDGAEEATRSIRHLAEQQKAIALACRTATPETEYGALASREDELQQDLAELAGEHPEVAQRVQKACRAAGDALGDAADALRAREQGRPSAGQDLPAVGRAASLLDELADEFEAEMVARQLVSSYELECLLEAAIEQMEGLQERPDAMARTEVQEAAQNAKSVTDQLKRVADGESTMKCFRPALREALGDEAQQTLNTKCNVLGNAPGGPARHAAASAVVQELEALREAFEQSRPDLLNMMRPSVGDPGGGRFFRLLKMYYPPGADVDERVMRTLVNEPALPHAETLPDEPALADTPGALHFDPATLPPTYRDRIEKYYNRLAETER